MSVAIGISSLLKPVVQTRGETGSDSSKATSAFDSMLRGPSPRDAGKGVRTPEDGGEHAAWSWSRLQPASEDAESSLLARGAGATSKEGETDHETQHEAEFAVAQNSDSTNTRYAALQGIQPGPTNEPKAGTEGQNTNAKSPVSDLGEATRARDARAELDVDVRKATKSSSDAEKDIFAARTDPRPAAPGTNAVTRGDQTLHLGKEAHLASADRPSEATERGAQAKHGLTAAVERSGLDRPPVAPVGDTRGDFRARTEALRGFAATNGGVQRAVVAQASSGALLGEPELEADARGKLETRSPVLSQKLQQDGRNKDPIAQRVTVISNQTTPVAPPAPAPAQLSSSLPSTQVVTAIREEAQQVARAAAAMEAQDASSARARPLHTIQIQLQPVDLGRVTARISLEGNQLHVELRVETSQARTQLSNDADSILKSLKASGFEIERVTVQQVQPGNNAAAMAGQERGGNPLASQNSGSDEANEQRRQNAFGKGEENAPQDGNDGTHQKAGRGGLFI